MASGSNSSLIWFRKSLRIHDNPALEYSSSQGRRFLCEEKPKNTHRIDDRRFTGELIHGFCEGLRDAAKP
ncbi:(6-4)DNA photolyase [Sarracenia purpurea var. burkii]